MVSHNRILNSFTLLVVLIGGLLLMGLGLGDDYASTFQLKSAWLTLFGLLICFVSGYLMSYIVPGPTDKNTNEDRFP